MKIGIVFAGQGAQYSGMGKDLYDSYPQAKEIFDLAGDQIKEWCFEGDAETFFFNDTATTEIYTLSYTLSLHDALPISFGRRCQEPLGGRLAGRHQRYPRYDGF